MSVPVGQLVVNGADIELEERKKRKKKREATGNIVASVSRRFITVDEARRRRHFRHLFLLFLSVFSFLCVKCSVPGFFFSAFFPATATVV